MSNLTRTHPLTVPDNCLGALLSVGAGVGIPANTVALLYFWGSKVARRSNNSYFKKLYMNICIIDFFICLAQTPCIEAMCSGRAGALFKLPWFQECWLLLWRSLIVTSVFMVAVISLSRLLILLSPRTQLNHWPVFIPASIFSFSLFLHSIALGTEHITAEYFPGVGMSPMFLGYLKNTEYDYQRGFHVPDPIPKSVTNNDVILNYLFSCFLGLPILPICSSFVLSTYLLNKAKSKARNQRASIVQHQQASMTILLVTLVYLICNIPVFTFLVMRAYRLAILPNTGLLSLHELYRGLMPSYFEKMYVKGLSEIVLVVINSTLNPVLYFWRISSFRDFVLRKDAGGMKIRQKIQIPLNLSLPVFFRKSNRVDTVGFSD